MEHREGRSSSCSARMLVLAALVTAAASTNMCTGSSVNLPQAQCEAWIAFYNSTNGDKWIPQGGAAACTRTDPCSCMTDEQYPSCDPTGTTVLNMLSASPRQGALQQSFTYSHCSRCALVSRLACRAVPLERAPISRAPYRRR
jgi:hypothetical protein